MNNFSSFCSHFQCNFAMDSHSIKFEYVLNSIHILSTSAATIATLTNKRPAVPELHVRTSATSRWDVYNFPVFWGGWHPYYTSLDGMKSIGP